MTTFFGSINWSVELPDYPIDISNLAGSTKTLDITYSALSFFPIIEWSFTGSPALFEDGYISIGSKVRFIFKLSETAEYYLDCNVLKIYTVPSESFSKFSPVYHLVLTSPLYFKQKSLSKAYKGRCSDVFKQACLDEYPDISVFIPKSGDEESVYYRTHETLFSFLNKYLYRWYGLNKDSILFLYIKPDNSIRGFSDPESVVEKQTIIYLYDFNTSIPNELNTNITPIGVSEETTAYAFYSGGVILNKEESLVALIKPIIKYIRNDSLEYNNLEEYNEISFLRGKNKFYPIFSDTSFGYIKFNVPSKVYVDYSLKNHLDVYLHNRFDLYMNKYKNFIINLAVQPNIFILPGDVCKIQFLSLHNDLSKFSYTTYQVLSHTLHFEGFKAISNIILSSNEFDYRLTKEVLRYFAK